MGEAFAKFFQIGMIHSMGKWTVVLAGIVAGQFFLYGPSLVGKKVLLPLDLLAVQNVYLPAAEVANITPHDPIIADLALQWEPSRQFALAEFHAGRLPMWNPYQFAGCPVSWPKFSPFLLLECTTASPVILAWTQLFIAIIAGFGAYAFFHRALSVNFWAATIPAWCYPLTGFFIFWQGYPTCYPICWLPWLLLAVDGTLRRGNRLSPIGLSIATGLTIVSGALDVAGQVLLVSGLYAIWCLWDEHRQGWLRQRAQRVIAMAGAGWLLGFLLAAPYLLPLLEYAHTGSRMERRSAGGEERPPVGLSALPQVVLPDMYGSSQTGSLRFGSEGNQIERSAAAYAGVILTLLAAPLAWCSRRHRSFNLFWCFLILFALGWCLNVPGLVTFLRMPGLNMMSHSRLVFAASFGILALAAIGLDAFWRGDVQKQSWQWVPMVILAALFVYCIYRTIVLPEPIATRLQTVIAGGEQWGGVRDLNDVQTVQAWFRHSYAIGAMLCDLGIFGWLILWRRPQWPRWSIIVPGFFFMADLIWFGHGRSAQCDPALYYPRIPVLEQIAKSAPGRIVGFSCLPAALAQTQGLHDIRGYDAIDPARMMDVMALAADPRSPVLNYSQTQWFTPRVNFEPPDGVRLSPILDMLDVRYVIFRGAPVSGMHPAFYGDDYWALVNHAALPRAFVPRQIEVITNDDAQLAKLASPHFDPSAVAYVESPVDLPDSCDGDAQITSETSDQVTLSLQMKTTGLVVLADLWDKGWKASLNGRPALILRVDHVVRGVIAPPGHSILEFRFAPQSFMTGLYLAGLAGIILLAWYFIEMSGRKKPAAN
jgi:hypothetical protein